MRQPAARGRGSSARNVLPVFEWPRRYALHWQLTLWLGCLLLAVIAHI
jgi:hypothetical protein